MCASDRFLRPAPAAEGRRNRGKGGRRGAVGGRMPVASAVRGVQAAARGPRRGMPREKDPGVPEKGGLPAGKSPAAGPGSASQALKRSSQVLGGRNEGSVCRFQGLVCPLRVRADSFSPPCRQLFTPAPESFLHPRRTKAPGSGPGAASGLSAGHRREKERFVRLHVQNIGKSVSKCEQNVLYLSAREKVLFSTLFI